MSDNSTYNLQEHVAADLKTQESQLVSPVGVLGLKVSSHRISSGLLID